MISCNDPALSRSTALGRPSFTLKIVFTASPAALQHRRGASRGRNMETEFGEPLGHVHRRGFIAIVHADKHRSLVRQRRARARAAPCANASPKFSPTPITSPVDRISGPSAGSTPGNLLKGNTGDFTKHCGTGSTPEIRPR